MTPITAKIILLGRLGRGPIELCHAHGTLVDARATYDEAVTLAGQALGDLVSEGKAESVQVPSHYTKQTYRVWRLAGSVPMEASAAVAAPAGHISAADFRAQAQRGANKTQRGRK